MAVFAEEAANLSTPVSGVYAQAAVQVNSGCGPGFVNASVVPIKGTGPSWGNRVGVPGVMAAVLVGWVCGVGAVGLRVGERGEG